MKLSFPITRRSALAFAAAFSLVAQAHAQGNDRVTIVVPYPPGSAPDFLARLIANTIAAPLGRTVVVDNRPGANAIIGSDYVSKAKPDGTTLLLADRMTVVANPLLYSKLPYDPKALQGVSDIARVNLALAVPASAPYKTWAEFVAFAKTNPEKISIGSGGPGSVHHLSLELLQKTTGAKLVHVPYKGITPAVQDVLGGQLSGVISGPEVIRQHVAAGALRVLAVGGEQRSSLFPQAPTLRELGVTTSVLLPTTFTLFAPPATPDSAVAPFSSALFKVLQQPDVVAKLAELGLVPTPSSAGEIKVQLVALSAQIGDVIRSANIRLD
jgi:tripartite-type tricarboxylate transporter receptor subunit TctC